MGNTHKIIIGFLVVIAGSVSVFLNVAAKNNQNNLTIFSSRENIPAKLRVGFPVSMTIPSIGVDAFMQYVNTTPDGSMDAPDGPKNVGWLDIGARPGDIGTAIIAGHSGYSRGIQGVFDDLDQVSIGDHIEIRDDKGSVMVFVVREIKSYPRDADASEVFNSNDGKAHLNLITCNGSWDNILKTHSKRLVVFTDRVE